MAETPLEDTGTARAFRRLGETQAAHAAGDAMVAVALADTLFFAVPVGEARDKVALYLGVTMTPFAVLSPVVGPWLDRHRGSLRLAIVAAALGRAVLALVLAGRTGGLELYPLAFGLLVLSRVHGVSRSALVPEVASERRSLVGANARLAIISVLGGAAGAGVAAALIRFFDTDAALWAGTAAFTGAALTGLQLPSPASREPPRPRLGNYRTLLSSRLLAAGIAMATSRAAVGFLTFLLAFVLRAGGERGTTFATVVAAGAAGGFAGSLVAPPLRKILREPALLLAGLWTTAAVAWWAAPRFDVTAAAIVAAVTGLAAGAGRLAFDSVVQQDIPVVARGRTFARYEGAFQLAWVVGAALGTLFPAGAANGLRTLTALCAGGSLFSLRGLLRARTRPTIPPGSEASAH